MSSSAILGICKAQFTPLDCDGNQDLTRADVVYCGLTDIQVTPVLNEGLIINDPSGQPNRNCVELNVDPEVDYYDVLVTTCSLYDPNLDNLLGYSDGIANADNEIIGSKAKKKNNTQCLCDCGDDACQRRVGLTIWSLNLCPGENQFRTFHPDGKYSITVLPAVQFRPNVNPIQYNTALNGRQYIGRGYENPNFGQGPGLVIPATETPFDRCWYRFPSDVCPPANCDCGNCGDDPITPYSFNVAGPTTA